ncbi:DNA repair protein RecN [Deltaproteobacteria bacterium]|nr:DNA repair protein RecN [Deltaproteobacteria bacterium]
MLSLLRIRQLAIIDELEVPFGEGLNIVTGETGAGKSILVDALQLVLGARARPDLVRAGAERAEVEALFDLRNDPAARARLGPDIAPDGELVLRRVVEAEGRTRVYIDGRLGTVAELSRLAAGLCDISSQHEHHSLVDPATHLGYLDAYAGLAVEAAAMREAWERLAASAAQLDALRAAVREDRADWLRFQLAELERVRGLNVDEGEVARLRNVDQLVSAVSRAEARLYAEDGAVCGALGRVESELNAAGRLDPALAPFADRLATARAELEDVATELSRYLRGLHADPARLVELEEAAHEVRRLRRKHGDDLGAAEAGLQGELAALAGAAEQATQLEAAIVTLRREVNKQVARLAEKRREEAGKLAAAITAELASLGMGEALVAVDVAQAGVGPRGGDKVEFLIATNRGEEPRPLRRVASGGELSRALLAVKRVLAALGPVGMYVFDEVDSGVGGAVAEGIGRKLHDVSRHHQVVCVTHLPQIAAWGDHHFHVRKDVVGVRTLSSLRRLNHDERIEELARMLGGVRVGTAARAAAAELLASSHS